MHRRKGAQHAAADPQPTGHTQQPVRHCAPCVLPRALALHRQPLVAPQLHCAPCSRAQQGAHRKEHDPASQPAMATPPPCCTPNHPTLAGTPWTFAPAIQAQNDAYVAHLGDGSCERGLSVVHMPNGADVHVWLCARVDVVAEPTRQKRRSLLQGRLQAVRKARELGPSSGDASDPRIKNRSNVGRHLLNIIATS